DVDQREQVAADAGIVLRRHVEDRARRNRRIDRVAAAAQDLEPRLGREWIARGNHAVPGEDLRASLRQPPLHTRSRDGLDGGARLRLIGGWPAKRSGRLSRRGERPYDGEQHTSD